MRYVLGPAAALALAGACGSDDGPCDPVARTGCEDGLVCEEVMDGEPACFAPVVVRGDVFDLETDEGVEGARVVAQGANRSPVSSVALTDMDGGYELEVPSLRTDSGEVVSTDVTLRADAQGYQTFPSGIRRALPIDTGTAAMAMDEDKWVIESAVTSVGLIPLPADSGTNVIRGEVESPGAGTGVLVVAETSSGSGSANGYTGIADTGGDYAIFNVPDGDYTVKGYARGANYGPGEASVSDGSEAEVNLDLDDRPTSTLSGKVEIVNPGAGTATSVILVVASTFDEDLARGESPPGLRVPDPGLAPDVAGEFSLEGVPAGRYKILAAFENDNLVRDPDTCISGTGIVEVEVAAGEDIALDQSFKVTGALDVLGPGASGPEEVSGSPTMSWVDDSSEDNYDVTVVDALGNEVWTTSIAGVSGSDPEVAYGGPALESGMYYQFSVVSSRSSGGSTCEIAATEDLKGVFYVP